MSSRRRRGGSGPRTRSWIAARRAIVDRLRAAAANDDQMDVHTALLLSMTGPPSCSSSSPERSGRRHARERIDHALDGTFSQPVADSVLR